MSTRNLLRSVVLSALSALVLTAGAAADVPQTLNYQVMLTDDADQPLADQVVALDFAIFDVPEGGVPLWSEFHALETNSIGVVSVVLGQTNPLTFQFDQPLWLQVEVNGEPLMPRRELAAASTARHAHDSELLGGVPAPSYALDNDLYQPGTLNDPSNPLEWTKLKNVPSGFADGIDHAGTGDGHSLDSSDGSPQDVVYVDGAGHVHVGEHTDFLGKMRVVGADDTCAIHIETSTGNPGIHTVRALSDSGTGLYGYSGSVDLCWFSPTPAGVMGFSDRNGAGGYFTAMASGRGVYCQSAGAGAALDAYCAGTGYAGRFVGGSGVFVQRPSGFPALRVNSGVTSGFGDVLWLKSEEGSGTGTWLLHSDAHGGNAGRFTKMTDDDSYVVKIGRASCRERV